MKIYDSFLFFNELDLLEIRLTLLYPYVDYFIISECDYTFSGNKKPFYFDENKDLFSKFSNKIIHLKHFNSDEVKTLKCEYIDNKKIIFDKIINYYGCVNNSPETDFGKPQWCREYLHREFISLGLSECDDDDIIIFSDLDEIPNPEIIKNIQNLDLENNKFSLYMDNHNYFINNLASTNWMGSVISNYKNLKKDSLNNLRKFRGNNIMINNGGWHLSFMGGAERIKYKIESYGHQEFNNDYIKSNITNKINSNTDLFNRPNYSINSIETYYFNGLKTVDIETYYPIELTNLVKTKFDYLIKK